VASCAIVEGVSQIIVGMDESEGAAAALRWAVRESHLRGGKVKAVLAWDHYEQHQLTPDANFELGYDQTAAEEVLAAIVARAAGEAEARHVALEAVRGHAAGVLLEQAGPDDMLVVGARGLGGFARLLLGSVSGHCLQHARCPVAVVRSPQVPRATVGRIVVGVDGSAGAQRALHWALAEARLRAATVEVVHAWKVPVVGGMYAYSMEPSQAEERARAVVAAALRDEDTSGVPVETTLVSGGAAEVVLREADDADLVVLGSRGLGGFRRLLLGSVGQQVAHHVSCPIVVVPHHWLPAAQAGRTDGRPPTVTG
jgi:nucleotide-binding universal stress UspA family protein